MSITGPSNPYSSLTIQIPSNEAPLIQTENELLDRINRCDNLLDVLTDEEALPFFQNHGDKITNLYIGVRNNLEEEFYIPEEKFIRFLEKIVSSKSLTNLISLEVILYDGYFDPRAGELIGRLFQFTPRLTTFRFYDLDCDDENSPSFTSMIAGFQNLHHLTDLTIDYSLTDRDLISLVKFFPNFPSLTRLHLIATHIKEAKILGEKISCLQNLSDLYLGLTVDVENFSTIANSLLFVPKLTKLTINGSYMEPSIEAFSLLFRNHPAITEIHLTNIIFNYKMLSLMLTTIDGQPNLEILSFKGSFIEVPKSEEKEEERVDEKMIRLVTRIVKTLPKLKVINCEHFFTYANTEILRTVCQLHPNQPLLIV